MRISPCLTGGAILAALAFQPASAANVSVSFGQADFEMFYAITVDGNPQRGQSIDDFDYVDLGISVDRGDYTYGFTASSLLEQPVDEVSNGVSTPYDTERDSYSFSVSRNLSEKLSLTGGYYAAKLAVESDTPGKEDTIETDAFFASLTYADRLTDKLFWYGRFSAQINDGDLKLNKDNGIDVLQFSADGDGTSFGAGIFYPLDATRGLTFAAEHKDFTYDAGLTNLEESQTLFTIGYNFQF